jgi:hypothetical protein
MFVTARNVNRTAQNSTVKRKKLRGLRISACRQKERVKRRILVTYV